MNKPNYIFVKSYYKELRDIVITAGTVIKYNSFYDQWEDTNMFYSDKEVNYLLRKDYIQEHKPEENQLTLDHYLMLVGSDKNNTVAVEIWKTLENFGYTIYKEKYLAVVDDPPIKKDICEIPY